MEVSERVIQRFCELHHRYHLAVLGHWRVASSLSCAFSLISVCSARQGIVGFYGATGDHSLLQYAESWGRAHGYKLCTGGELPNASLQVPAEGLPPPIVPRGPTNANNELGGQIYMDLYVLDGNRTKIKDTLATLQVQVNRTATNDWAYADALHMAMGTFSKACNITGDLRYCEKLYSLFSTAVLDGPPDGISTFQLWSQEDSLLYRDDSFINTTDQDGNKIFWARANGWGFAALATTLKSLPSDDPHRGEYERIFVQLALRLKALQPTDVDHGGCWRASLLNPALENASNPETTGTALFVYGMAYGVNAGLLPEHEFVPTIARAWDCLARVSVQPSTMLGYCQPAGVKPAGAQANSTFDFCVGNFLLAGSELVHLIRTLDDFKQLQSNLVARFTSVSTPASTALVYARALLRNGTWPDIEYYPNASEDTRTQWGPNTHLSRLRTITVAYSSTSGGTGDPTLLQGALKALDFWLQADLKNPDNWYPQVRAWRSSLPVY
jgi:rhamnogalacturonyl hydrolase YesR